MIFDTHMHCNNSCDSHMDLIQAVQAAARKKIGIIVTEHWDYDYPTNPEAFIFDIDRYFADFQPLLSPQVLIGIEIGMQKHIADEDDRIAGAYDFDYVLGSVHCADRKDIYEKSFYQGRDKHEVTEAFLREAAECVENHDDFDAFAHIDYICRYWPYKEREFSLSEHRTSFDRLFTLLIKKNKPMEINTRRLDDPCSVAALTELYRRYRYLGGRYCTLGSDAHYEEHVGRRLDTALQIAAAAELTPVYFKARKMCLIGEEK